MCLWEVGTIDSQNSRLQENNLFPFLWKIVMERWMWRCHGRAVLSRELLLPSTSSPRSSLLKIIFKSSSVQNQYIYENMCAAEGYMGHEHVFDDNPGYAISYILETQQSPFDPRHWAAQFQHTSTNSVIRNGESSHTLELSDRLEGPST